MRRTILIVVSICIVMQPFRANAGWTAKPLAPAQDKQKFAEAQQANSAAARQYTWKSRTELKLKGESKSIKLEQVRYDANGQLQKTPLDSGAPQQQPQPSGRRLKQKIVAKKTAEFGEMIKGLAGLVSSYAHLPQNQMQAFIQNASFKLNQEGGAIQITGQPGVVSGDSMSIWVDPSTMLFRRVAINTVYDKKPVSVACTYANTSSGLNYMAKAVLDYPGEHVQVTIDNYEYER